MSTAGIRGTITAGVRRELDARLRVSDDVTGFFIEVRVTGGRFLVQGLEPGDPYTVTVRALGFAPQRADRIVLTLGELREVNFALQSVARLDTVTVFSDVRPADARNDGGTGMTISGPVLEHLPTLNRDLYDFVRLTPQISTKIGLSGSGLSAAGMGFRFNNFLIDGVSERTLGGGVSNAFAGGKSIPLAAVQEYEVLLSPFDVRYGDFAGALINTVTKSGTNTFHGSVFAYGRNNALGRPVASDATPYERAQYGLAFGGPILRNRLHFFIAPELQRFTFPADGPYVGQPPDAKQPVPVSAADLDRFDAIMRSYGLTAGSAGPVENGNPLRNLFTRVDLALPEWNSRLLVWNNYSGSDDIAFSRRASPDTFSLSSYQVTRASQTRISALHLHTSLGRAGGGHNELLVSQRSEALDPIGAVEQPIVRVSVPSVSGASVTLNTGTQESAQHAELRASSRAVKDNLTLPLATTHVLTLGTEAEWFTTQRVGAAGSFGTWSFASLDNLVRGVADRYEVRIDFDNANASLHGAEFTAYAGDQWQATDRLSVTGGIRADLLALDGRAPYDSLVDSIFARRTDQMPRRRVDLSPRLGFVWHLPGIEPNRLRGGLGIFTGRYPLAWASAALSSYGVGGTLRCNLLGVAARYPPAFVPDYRARPTSCGGGSSITPSFQGDVDLLDKDLRTIRVARASLAYERLIPWNLLLTNEALVTRGLSDVALVNLNLAPSTTTDVYGRVMYGTIGSTGTAVPKLRSGFSEVIDLRSVAGNGSYQLSSRLETTRNARTSAFVSYTYSRARDAQTLLRVNTRGTVAWASARVNAGHDDDLTPSVSSNDVPHRVIVAGTYALPWSRGQTDLSFYYVGESGRPFTYLAYGTLGRGDLNADGSNANDPIYVPHNALDTVEIRFSGFSDSATADNSTATQANRAHAQRSAFENFVERNSCLRQQRGRILERNSCREPWSNTTTASVRQAVPVAGRALDVQLDVFNVLNLLNSGWGLQRQAVPALLEHVGQTTGPALISQPIFRFNSGDHGWATLPVESDFQLQLAVHYRF